MQNILVTKYVQKSSQLRPARVGSEDDLLLPTNLHKVIALDGRFLNISVEETISCLK